MVVNLFIFSVIVYLLTMIVLSSVYINELPREKIHYCEILVLLFNILWLLIILGLVYKGLGNEVFVPLMVSYSLIFIVLGSLNLAQNESVNKSGITKATSYTVVIVPAAYLFILTAYKLIGSLP